MRFAAALCVALIGTSHRTHRTLAHKISANAVSSNVFVYTNKTGWEVTVGSGYDIESEDFEDSMPLFAAQWTMSSGANDVGLFDVYLGSSEYVNSLDRAVDGSITFNGSYKKGSSDITLNNFDYGNVYGFGGSWKIAAGNGSVSSDFKVRVNGALVDIARFLQPDAYTFVGIVDLKGFSELDFYTAGEDVTLVSIESIDVAYVAPSSTPSNKPTISLSPSSTPTSSSFPSLSPSVIRSNSPSNIFSEFPTSSLRPSINPSERFSGKPSQSPSGPPTMSISPSESPSTSPSGTPSAMSSDTPTLSTPPSLSPTAPPSVSPSAIPSLRPSSVPSLSPSWSPTRHPTLFPSASPTTSPTVFWSVTPTTSPSDGPTVSSGPSSLPSVSAAPSDAPSTAPSFAPSTDPSARPTPSHSDAPSVGPSRSLAPSDGPSTFPSRLPSIAPSWSPSSAPSVAPSAPPSSAPSRSPSSTPSVAPSAPPTCTYVSGAAGLLLAITNGYELLLSTLVEATAGLVTFVVDAIVVGAFVSDRKDERSARALSLATLYSTMKEARA